MSALRTRERFEREEDERLAPVAAHSAASRGRLFPESEHPYRTAYQRDRDRIVHSRAFRRLEYKTQVFVPHEGDHYRNRLTHSLEASQMSRTLARMLRLNEELAEAIALSHDLGHTPFGHAGERVLARLMKPYGGFDHNRQSLRVVDWLEERYPSFRGLNLTYESREGILKHGCHWDHPLPVPEATPQRGLEAQLADKADEIAYTNHDIDDGLRSGLLDASDLDAVPLWRDTLAATQLRVGATSERMLHAQTIVALINALVGDLAEASAERIARSGARSIDAVRQCRETLIGFSPETAARFLALKRFLSERLYHHPRVLEMNAPAEGVIGELFEAYAADAGRLPQTVRERFEPDGHERAIADYIAGMTDRFALSEQRRLAEAS
ncbi:MAG TPA: deoxyguanosinetriphosphate triphosphohydrolase [Myxococcota bacterium]|nr:deoxyguanosinetriphosphate triphosphohydrolase [Myxococcota bacterium]